MRQDLIIHEFMAHRERDLPNQNTFESKRGSMNISTRTTGINQDVPGRRVYNGTS